MDIESRADIERLVDGFYARVQADDRLGPIFNDVARVDWAEHLPKMYAFWDSVLFGSPGFKGNPLVVHRALAQVTTLSPAEFRRWLDLFRETVDRLFAGPRAEFAKTRAEAIAATLERHVSDDRTSLPITR